MNKHTLWAILGVSSIIASVAGYLYRYLPAYYLGMLALSYMAGRSDTIIK